MRSAIVDRRSATFAPDLLVVDKIPRGAFDELDAVLPVLRSRHGTRTVLGLRDVLDGVDATEREWRVSTHQRGHPHALRPGVGLRRPEPVRPCGGVRVVRRDAGQGRLHRLPRPRPRPPLRDPVEHETGCPSRSAHGTPPSSSASSVEDRTVPQLAQAFAEARYPSGHEGILLTGPYAPAPLVAELSRTATERSDLCVARIAANVPQLVSSSAATVSMGGYNSACELMAGGRPALVVPRTAPAQGTGPARRTPGCARARRRARRRRPRPPTSSAAGSRTPSPAGRIPHSIDLAGLRRLPELADDVLGEARRRPEITDHAARLRSASRGSVTS